MPEYLVRLFSIETKVHFPSIQWAPFYLCDAGAAFEILLRNKSHCCSIIYAHHLCNLAAPLPVLCNWDLISPLVKKLYSFHANNLEFSKIFLQPRDDELIYAETFEHCPVHLCRFCEMELDRL